MEFNMRPKYYSLINENIDNYFNDFPLVIEDILDRYLEDNIPGNKYYNLRETLSIYIIGKLKEP